MGERDFIELARRAVETTGGPSIAIAIVRDAKVEYAGAVGRDRVNPDRSATAATVYNVASVTKQFTAACALLLAREGKLSLDDPVGRWFPKVARSKEVTIRHLLTHTSGYFDCYPLSFADEEKLTDTTPAAVVENYAREPLQFEPGSACSYSNTGFHLAGLIVEEVAAEPFGAFLERRVLGPSGMRASFFNDAPRVTDAHAIGYTRYALGPLREAERERAGWMFASGGLAATAGDLAEWICGYFDNRLLAANEVAAMTTSFVLSDGSRSESGLGLFLEHRGEYRTVSHSGGIAGFTTQIVFSPEERCGIVAFSNGDQVPSGRVTSQLVEKLIPGARPPAPPGADGDAFVEEAQLWFERFAAGELDSTGIGRDLRRFLTGERLDDARAGLAQLGKPSRFDRMAGGERGGMQWARVRAHCANGEGDVVLRIAADGTLEEFNIFPVL